MIVNEHELVRDAMNRDVVVVGPSHSLRQTAAVMTRRNVGAAVVEDLESSGVGIITERDMTARVIAAGLNPDTATAADIMTSNPDTLAPDDTASDAINMMRKRNYRHLPVVDGPRVVGMVSVARGAGMVMAASGHPVLDALLAEASR